MSINKTHNHKLLRHGVILMLLIGGLSYSIEHFGEGHLSSITAWIDRSGNFAPFVFMLINVVGMLLVLPQTIFTVVAGVLFGAIKGTAMCLISMAAGSTLSFFLGRFVFRGRILKKFGSDPNFVQLEMLSRKHPVKILALSRIVPVVPYSVANYLWSVTRVGFLPYIVMSVACLVPETVFLTAGGHILSAGVVKGTLNWAMLLTLVAAGTLIVFLVKAVKRSIDRDRADD